MTQSLSVYSEHAKASKASRKKHAEIRRMLLRKKRRLIINKLKMDFHVNKLENSSSRFCLKGSPKVIGYLSTDENGKCSADLSQLKYYIPGDEGAKIHFDLNDGYDKVIKKKFTSPHNIDELLSWVQLHHTQVKSCRPDFISMRGVIITLFLTLTKRDDGWIICAAKFNGTIYLCAPSTKIKQDYDSTRSERQKRMDSWGFKFEQYILRDNLARPPDTSKPVNENEEFCCLFSNEFGNHRLLYAAEMDGVQSNDIITENTILEDKIKFVELKTNKQLVDKDKPNYSFKMKMTKAWCQSSLSCVEEVLIGFRDADGIVNELKRYSVNEVSELTKTIFNCKEAMNICNNFLDHVKRVVTEDTDKFIYKFSWNPKTETYVKGEKLENTNNQSEYSFLPEWFTANRIPEKIDDNFDLKKNTEERYKLEIIYYLLFLFICMDLCNYYYENW